MRTGLLALLLSLSEPVVPVVGAAVLRFPIPDAPATLDWTGTVTTTEAPIVNLLSEGLFRYEYPGGVLVPAVAESVEKSEDLKRYVFHIRKEAKWSDGRPVYAQDFVEGWLRVISPYGTSLYNYYFFDILNAEEYRKKKITDASLVGFRADGERKLVVEFKRPVGRWESVTSFWPFFPVRKDLIEKYGANLWRAGVLPSNGPFLAESLEPGKKMVLKRNSEYPKGQSNLDTVEVVFDQDSDGLLDKYRNGTYSFLPNPKTTAVKEYAGKPDLQHPRIFRNHVLVSNALKFPMNNRDFRKAVYLSIDRKKVQSKASFPCRKANNLIPVPLPGSVAKLAPETDRAAAKKALKRSGLVLGPKFKLRILTRIDPANVSVGKEVQDQLQATLGINVDLAALHEREFNLFANLFDYDIILVGWSAKVPVPEDFLRPYGKAASNSRLKFDSPYFQQWIEEGMRARTEKESMRAFAMAQKHYLTEEFVMLPLLDEDYSILRHPGIRNLEFNHIALPVLSKVIVDDGTSKKE
jgi:oligopeptide transport system substrate-binding protein